MADAGMVQLAVHDSGQGMDDETRLVFLPLAQSGQAVVPAGRGGAGND